MRILLFIAITCMSLMTAEAQSTSLKKRIHRPHPISSANNFLSEKERNGLIKSAIERVLRELQVDNPQQVILLIDNINPQYFASLGMPMMSEYEMREKVNRGEKTVYLYVSPYDMNWSKAIFSIIHTRIQCPGPKVTCDRLSQSFNFDYRRVNGRMKLKEMLPIVLS
jgi:hypothetical protein